jgi:hypothetical protein
LLKGDRSAITLFPEQQTCNNLCAWQQRAQLRLWMSAAFATHKPRPRCDPVFAAIDCGVLSYPPAPAFCRCDPGGRGGRSRNREAIF